jgi:hypothetical protein
MRSKAIFLMVIMAILFAFENQGQAAIDIQDGGSHVIDNNSYQNSTVNLDRTIANNPGTHVDMVDGGQVGSLGLFNKSSLTMTGGSVGGSLYGWQNSTITVSGGSINTFYAIDNSKVTMTGGQIGELAAGFNSTMTISGGSFDTIRAYYNGTIYLAGTGFKVDGQPLSYDDKLSDFGTFYTRIPWGLGWISNVYTGTITGRLADGSYLNNPFYVHTDGSAEIFVIPEPATILLVGLGMFALRKKQKV